MSGITVRADGTREVSRAGAVEGLGEDNSAGAPIQARVAGTDITGGIGIIVSTVQRPAGVVSEGAVKEITRSLEVSAK